MPRPLTRYGLIFGVLLAIAPMTAAEVNRQQAEVFARKLGEIAKPNPPAIEPGMRRTPITEAELNSWFAYAAQPLLPAGVAAPAVTILGDGKLQGTATVDLEAIGKRRSSGGLLDPWSMLGGRVPVTVRGTLHTQEGRGRFELESADVSGVPVPPFLLQEMVSFYSRSERRPDGIKLDDPFTLPANIQKIEVGQGRAVVVQ
jgi:hypothetical protein